jgi:peptide alpha-N-acetyltransferase
MTTTLDGSGEPSLPELHYIQYDPDKEAQYLTAIRELISKDLSEPYSIYVYRYFLYQWADLCYMVCTSSFLEIHTWFADFCSRQWIRLVN